MISAGIGVLDRTLDEAPAGEGAHHPEEHPAHVGLGIDEAEGEGPGVAGVPAVAPDLGRQGAHPHLIARRCTSWTRSSASTSPSARPTSTPSGSRASTRSRRPSTSTNTPAPRRSR